MNTQIIISDLRDKGYRITNTRKEIINIFYNTNNLFSAADIYSNLHSKKLKVNKTTVYRELFFLVKHKYLNEVYIDPQKTLYESAKHNHHHHLVCEVCGKIDKITNCLSKDFERDVLEKRGFKIKKHILEFYGICDNCLNKYH